MRIILVTGNFNLPRQYNIIAGK